MGQPVELTSEECLALLGCLDFGRLAFDTPLGPRIVPLNYTLDGESILVRTTFYTELGTYGPGQDAAFEIDQIDTALSRGWSVVVVGRLAVVDDPDEVQLLRATRDPQPWAGGIRRRYLRLSIRNVTGRTLTTP